MLFWERGRILFNGILLLITAFIAFVHWPRSNFLLTTGLSEFPRYALIANVLYSLVYVLEVILQIRYFKPSARRTRLIVLILAMILASLLAGIALSAEILRSHRD